MITLQAAQKSTDSGSRIEITLNGDAIPPQLQASPIFFEIDGSAADLDVLDGYLGAVIHFVMESRQDLHVQGRVSRSCLRRLSEYQKFWSLVRPERYSSVTITAEETVADWGDTRDLPAVAAYSGGVDSAFTVVRHAKQLVGMDTIPLEAVLIVHGFDVGLGNVSGFGRLLERLQPVIEELGLRRYVVRTNLKELSIQNWIESYTAQLVGCLHLVSHRHSQALVASDGYGQDPVFQFGGNPISVPLLSTSRLKILYEGAQWGRTSKIALVARYPNVRRSLRFCWEGADVYRNCGRCRKCLTTYMSFRAIGIEADCFDTPIDEDIVGNYVVTHDAELALRYDLLEHLHKDPALAELTARFAAPLLRYEAEQQQAASQPQGGHAPAEPLPVGLAGATPFGHAAKTMVRRGLSGLRSRMSRLLS